MNRRSFLGGILGAAAGAVGLLKAGQSAENRQVRIGSNTFIDCTGSSAGPTPEFCPASNTDVAPWVQPDAPPHPLDKVNDSIPYDFGLLDKDTYNRGPTSS